MAAVDRDTFIPIGTSVVKLLLIASGQGALATAVGEGAGLLAKFRRTLEIGGKRAVFAEKIADDAAKQLLREHQGVSEADWHVAARQAASLIDRLSEKERLAAGYNWDELRRTLLDLGGTGLRSGLADESARQAFDWVLEVACQRVADCFTEKEALASILESVDEVRVGIQRLADRPAGASQTRAVVADHLDVVRDLAPDPLEDRERELAELETFVRGSQDTWYAMEASMISGKTALMSSFTLNPPSGVHIVSFFIRRMGGDGNDWRSFSFVAGAQLAEILGDEYTERVSEPASQNTEFRQLLRRAATACQSDKNPRPLILVIDGVDEDSYYEDPDAPDAKSILSLLPRHLPEGVKVITASRPNPRPPEDIVCNCTRTVVSLKASPIAQKKINQKEIKKFFKSDLAVDIGAFLAACGGSLTINDLRQLIATRRHRENIPSRDIEACVDHSPGRMLMRVNVGFGDREISSYTLGHDAVLKAVLRELAADLCGEDEDMEDEGWWAQAHERALMPYRQEILGWVENWASEGWGNNTPIYMLSDACFDLMFKSGAKWNNHVQAVFDRDRYNAVWRRSGKRSQALRMIDRECNMILDRNEEPVFKGLLKHILDVIEFREFYVRLPKYASGMLELRIRHFDMTPEEALDIVLSIDDPKVRLDGARDILKATLGTESERDFLPVVSAAMHSLASFSQFYDDAISVVVGEISNNGWDSDIDCIGGEGGANPRLELMDEILRSFRLDVGELHSHNIPKQNCVPGREPNEAILLSSILESAAQQIENSQTRIEVLTCLAQAYAGAEMNDEAGRIIVRCQAVLQKADDYVLYAGTMRKVSGVLVTMGMVDKAQEAAVNSQKIASRVHDRELRAKAMVEVAGGLAAAGMIEDAQRVARDAQRVARNVFRPDLRAKAMVEVVSGLAAAGMIEDALRAARDIDDDNSRSKAMAEVVDAAATAEMNDVIVQIADSVLRNYRYTNVTYIPLYLRMSRALIDMGEDKQAESVAKRVDSLMNEEIGWRNRTTSLTEVVRALVDAGIIQRARKIAEMERRYTRTYERPDLCYSNDERLLSLRKNLLETSKVLADARMFADAERTADKIDDFKLHGEALSELVKALANSRMFADAERVADRIGDFKLRGDALLAVIRAMVDMNMVGRARKLAVDLKQDSKRVDFWLRPWVLPSVVEALACVGMFEDAKRVARQISEVKSFATALAKAALVAANAGSVEQAREMVTDAQWIAEEYNDPHLKSKAMLGLVSVLVKVGDIDETLNVISMIDESDSRSCAHSAVLKEFVRKGSLGEAVSILRIALTEVEGIARRQEAADYCAVLATACLEASDLIDASSSMRERWLGLTRSVLARSWLYGASVWDHFDILMRVAPDLAIQLVDERILGDREPRAASESDPDLGPEGPGGDTGSYR